jgi:hypothetical protein
VFLPVRLQAWSIDFIITYSIAFLSTYILSFQNGSVSFANDASSPAVKDFNLISKFIITIAILLWPIALIILWVSFYCLRLMRSTVTTYEEYVYKDLTYIISYSLDVVIVFIIILLVNDQILLPLALRGPV